METMTLPIKKSEVELVEMFLRNRGAEVVTAEWTTDPKLRRTGNPWGAGQILKKVKISGMLNVRYENAVNRQREREGKEGNFKAKAVKWGTPLKGLPFKVHVNKQGEKKIYLQVMVLSLLGIPVAISPETGEVFKMDAKPIYFDKETGRTVPTEDVKPFFPKKNKSKGQGTEKEIIWRTPELGSLDKINLRRLQVIPKGWGL